MPVFTCRICGFNTAREANFTRHLRVHFNQTPRAGRTQRSERRGAFPCPFCRNSYAAVALRDRHILRAHWTTLHGGGSSRSPGVLVNITSSTRDDGGSSQQGVQAPAVSVQQLGSHTVTTTTFSNGAQFRSSSATGGDNHQSSTKVDSPGQNVRADPARKDCPVCLDEFDVSEHVFYPCGHSVCRACFRSWDSECRHGTNRCPLCRHPY